MPANPSLLTIWQKRKDCHALLRRARNDIPFRISPSLRGAKRRSNLYPVCEYESRFESNPLNIRPQCIKPGIDILVTAVDLFDIMN
jgi:hypothetical protein